MSCKDQQEVLPKIMGAMIEEHKTPLPIHNVLSGGIVGVGFKAGRTLNETGSLLSAVVNLDTRVAVGVHIFNATKMPLVPQNIFVSGCLVPPEYLQGKCDEWVPPHIPTVGPAEGEGYIARKYRHFPSGSHGTASWRIGSTDRYLVVGWSLPYSHIFHSNWLMTGIADSPVIGDCFREMYYRKQGNWFSRKAFSPDHYNSSLEHSADGYNILGFMGGEHTTTAKIVLMPDMVEDLEESLREFVVAGEGDKCC